MFKSYKIYLEMKKKANNIIIADECCSMMDGSGDGAYSGISEEDHQILDAVAKYEEYLNDDPIGDYYGRNE